MKNLELTRKEMEACQELVVEIAAKPDLVQEKLRALGKDPGAVCREIEDGVSDFYKLYEGEVNKETIQAMIQNAQKDMTPLQKYTYLANLMTAITHIEGRVFDDPAWEKCLEDHRNILSAIEMGLIEEDGLHVAEAVGEMQSLVSENIEEFAVLFVDNPDLAELQQACLTEGTDQVRAIAFNTRDMAVHTAEALYILQESGELPTLGDTRYPPKAMGILSATMLEMDAAQKTGSLETFKKVFQKAARVAVALLVASPGILMGMTLLGLIGFFTNFATLWMIIGGFAIGMNLKAHYDVLKEKMQPVYAFGGKVLDVTLDKVKPLYAKLSSWIQNTVLPKVVHVWDKCRTFIQDRILIPAVGIILKAKDAIIRMADHARDFVQKRFQSARNIEREANAAPTNNVTPSRHLENLEMEENEHEEMLEEYEEESEEEELDEEERL